MLKQDGAASVAVARDGKVVTVTVVVTSLDEASAQALRDAIAREADAGFVRLEIGTRPSPPGLASVGRAVR